MRKSLIVAGLLLLFAFGAAIVYGIRVAQHDAAHMRAIGRLSQLHLALANYETQHGILPPRHASDLEGNPTHSWLALVLPQFEEKRVCDKLDLTQSWDAIANADAIKEGNRFWQWFSRDGFFPCALHSEKSIWDSETGKPRGPLEQFPNSIVLVAIPLDGVHPLQPHGIDEAAVRQWLVDGKEILFITSDRVYGKARIQDGEIVYAPKHPT